MRISVTLPDVVVEEIDRKCSAPGQKVGLSSGRSRWIAHLIIAHLQLTTEQDLLFDHNSKRGPRKKND